MRIKGIIDIDLINYKLPCMTIEMPVCLNFKCDKECGKPVCQNSKLASEPTFNTKPESITEAYLTNDIVKALCFQGLEPFDTFEEMKNLIALLRSKQCWDDIVIYTGYNEDELTNQLAYLRPYRNIIVKFGRYIPNQEPHFDEVLGVNLASDNQYAKRIS